MTINENQQIITKKIIIDNTDPDRRPDVPVPSGFNKSVQPFSDTVEYTGSFFHGNPWGFGGWPNRVALTFHQISRQRTWAKISQFGAHPNSGGNYTEKVSEGVSTATGVIQRWDQTLGVELSAGFGPLSAKISAGLSIGGEKSVTVELSTLKEKTINFDFDKNVEAEYAAWQLEENYQLTTIDVQWDIPNGDPSKITQQMIEDAEYLVETGKKRDSTNPPFIYGRRTLLNLKSGTRQYETSYFPQLATINNPVLKAA
ncbi:hypothetical protein ACO0LC_10085 [Undibacterium sp. JH2W]|uniref:hypothetical protein n=1 Tax=Undibacterium sp. JH2W TaxID=3413037 RepID=UPI003BF40930